MARFELQRLVGKEIEEKRNIDTGISGRVIRKTKWTVIEAYPHFVRVMRVCDNDQVIYGTFNIGELITMGVLKDRRRITE